MSRVGLVSGGRNIFQDVSCGWFRVPSFAEIALFRPIDKRALLRLLTIIKEKHAQIICSKKFRSTLIISAFFVLIYIRLMAHAFGFSLGYLYLMLICLSGFWFGFSGAIVTATISSLIFLSEISIFRDWPLRDVVAKSSLLRICFFYAGGLVMAYFSNVEKCLRELKIIACYDELTGCANYRSLMGALNNEVNRCKRYNKEMAIIMIDIDHFKKINDTYGHILGNRILKSFAGVLKKNVRNVDIVGRYGGEEFLLILPEASRNDANVILGRIKEKLLEIQLPYSSEKESMEMCLRFSAGVSSFPLNGKTMDALITVADKALYEAKRCGGDKVIAERRRWARSKPASDFKIELVRDRKKTARVVEILNISEHGMLLALSDDFKGRDVACRMRLTEDGQPFECKCEIVHKEKTDKGFYLVGLYSEELPREACS